MIHRRGVLGLIAVAATGCATTVASPSRIALIGALEQGSLTIGRVPPGSAVTLDGAPLHVSADGDFAFGFAYDQTSAAILSVRFADGTDERREIVPVPRKYDIQRINGLPEPLVTPPPEVQARIQTEHAAVAEARKRDTDGLGFIRPLDWPASGIISGVYGSQRILNGEPKAPHFGVDIAAPEGSPIRAPADGIVSNSGDYYLEGGFTLIDHGHGVSTCYFHQSKRLVAEGTRLLRGDLIGLIGQTGRATGPHVHWGMNWFQIRLDPSRSTRTPAPPPAP
jgi:murein DD-endopeptidase MepM/ murein hydrolase activator NlpD